MRVTKEQKLKIKASILDAACSGFREKGFGGLGVDGLAKKAGLTSGAFYGHFASKQEAFNTVVETGLDTYSQGLDDMVNEHGEEWSRAFVDFYLGHDHVADLSQSCAVPGLSADVMRADKETKMVYEDKVSALAEKMAEHLSNHHQSGIATDRKDVWPAMAVLAGTVMMARCVNNPVLQEEMLASSQQWVEKMMNLPPQSRQHPASPDRDEQA